MGDGLAARLAGQQLSGLQFCGIWEISCDLGAAALAGCGGMGWRRGCLNCSFMGFG